MSASEEDKVQGRIHGEQPDPGEKDALMLRLVYMIIIWLMLSLAQSVLTIATVIQFVIMVINSGTPNERLGDFGTDLGIWIAKAARYQTGASEVKPWPWTELD
ncbi:MAG: DUF4389 domain-containing protein [Pseudomonadota bacterium]